MELIVLGQGAQVDTLLATRVKSGNRLALLLHVLVLLELDSARASAV